MDPRPEADTTSDAGDLHLVVGVGHHRIAIPLTGVREILALPRVFPIPGGPAHLRGFIDLRGGVLPAYDLRTRLGMPPRAQEIQELLDLLEARAEDHRAWVRELEDAVREHRPFGLTRDPHSCRFGKWYDTYTPENSVLEFLWPRFDEPHRRIHALADEVCERASRGEEAAALALIERARGAQLQSMLELFEQARIGVRDSSRELAVILTAGESELAITVDLTDGITEVGEGLSADLAELGLDVSGLPIHRTARREETNETLLVLDVPRLLRSADHAADPHAQAA
jgi:hypothetical protein